MIEKLTTEQEKALDQFRDAWIAIGKSTEPPDKEQIEHWIREAYKAGGQTEPKDIVFVDGGPEALLNAYIGLVEPKMTLKEAWNKVSGGLCYGAHDGAWLGFYEFFLSGGILPAGGVDKIEEYGAKPLVEGIEKIFPLIQLARHHCGWWLPLEGLAIVSQLPLDIQGKDTRHADGRPAIVYRGGLDTVWALNGVRVPQWLAETKATDIDPKRVAEISNAEVRREFVRKVGIDRICHAMKSEVIDKKGDYELLMLDIGDNNRRPYLKMKNPSIGCWHVEGVPPGTRTVDEANKWRRGEGFEDEPEVVT